MNGHVYIGPVAVIIISGVAALLSLGATQLAHAAPTQARSQMSRAERQRQRAAEDARIRDVIQRLPPEVGAYVEESLTTNWLHRWLRRHWRLLRGRRP